MGANLCSDLGMFRYVHDPVDVLLRSIKLFVPFHKNIMLNIFRRYSFIVTSLYLATGETT